jgi:hypothetical protein
MYVCSDIRRVFVVNACGSPRLRWTRTSALPDEARSLQNVHLAELLFFALRLIGATTDTGSGTMLARRCLHLVAQQSEVQMEDHLLQDLQPAGDDQGAVTRRTKTNKSVQATCIAKRYMSQPIRGIVTGASGGIAPVFYAAETCRDKGEGWRA